MAHGAYTDGTGILTVAPLEALGAWGRTPSSGWPPDYSSDEPQDLLGVVQAQVDVETGLAAQPSGISLWTPSWPEIGTHGQTDAVGVSVLPGAPKVFMTSGPYAGLVDPDTERAGSVVSPLFKHEKAWMFFASPRALDFLGQRNLIEQFSRFFNLALTSFPRLEVISVEWAKDPETPDTPWVTLSLRVREDEGTSVHNRYNGLIFALVDEKIPARDQGLLRLAIDIAEP